MATDRDDASGTPPNYGVKATYLIVFIVVFGLVMTVFVARNPQHVLKWFWIGIAVPVIYLLAALANNVERHRNES